jgi:hypothetical protein
MLATRGHFVAGGELLEEIHVGHQSGAREQTLEEIVAEERVLRGLPLERRLEGVDVVDPFSRVGAFFEEVLIHIGDRGGVGVHTAAARDDPLVGRAARAGGQGRRDPGLHDRVTFDDPPLSGVETRPVQRVSHRPDQPVGGALGKPGVGIQGDDVADALGHRRRPSADRNERGVRGAAKQPIQLVELPSFPLPADPLAFPLVPETPAVQQEEPRPASGRALVPRIEMVDAVGQLGNEFLVAGHALAGCVRPIGEESEVEMALRIGKVVHFEAFELLLEVGSIREQRGHGDHGPKLDRHASRELELGEPPRRKQSWHQAMDEGQRDVRGGDEAEDGQQDEDPGLCPSGPGDEQEAAELEGGQGSDPSQVSRDRVGAVGALQPQAKRNAKAQLPLEFPPALGNEVIPRVVLGARGNTGGPRLAPRGIALHRGGE